jgi:hypothetical protein
VLAKRPIDRATVRLVVVVEIPERAWLVAPWTMKHSGMFVVHGARELMPVAYEDGDYKVQPMRIEQW